MGYAEAQYTVDEVINALQQMGANESGIPPIKPWVTVVPAQQSVKVYFKVQNTDIEDQRVCTVKGVMIRKKLGSPITSISDGDLVGIYEDEEAWAHENTPVTITGLENGVWVWIGVWTFSDHNVYNLDMSNVRQVQPGVDIIYGFHQDFTDLNPETSITYIGANTGFTPMHTIEYKTATVGSTTKVVPDPNYTYGSWKTWSWLNAIQPFFVNAETHPLSSDPQNMKAYAHVRMTKANRLRADNYTIDADTGKIVPEVSQARLSGEYNGFSTFMYVWIPRLYVKEVYASDGNSRDVYFSETKLTSSTSDFVLRGFKDPSGNIVKGFWLGMGCFSTTSTIYTKGTLSMPTQPDSTSYGPRFGNDWDITWLFGNYASDYQFYRAKYGEEVLDMSKNTVAYKEQTTPTLGYTDIAVYGGVWHFLIRDILYMLYRSTNILAHTGTITSESAWRQIKSGIIWNSSMMSGGTGLYNKIFHSPALALKLQSSNSPDINLWITNNSRLNVIPDGYYDYNYTHAVQTPVVLNLGAASYVYKMQSLGNEIGSMGVREGSLMSSTTASTGLCSYQDLTDKTQNLTQYPPRTTNRIIYYGDKEGIHGYQGIDPYLQSGASSWTYRNYGYQTPKVAIPITFPPTNYTPYDDYEGGVPSQW